MTVDAEASAIELLEVACLECGAHSGELLPELRPEHAKVRLDDELRRFDVAELKLLHAKLLGNLVAMRS